MAAVMTSDFRLYHALLKEMRRLNIKHTVLSVGEDIPPYVGVVICSESETDSIDFPVKIGASDPVKAAGEALVYLSGTRVCRDVFIVIDPGKRPGLAVVCDGKVVEKIQAMGPEDCRKLVMNALDSREYSRALVRIGHGDITNRNRIIAAISGLGVGMEIVNEKNTSRYTRNSDIEAAIRIAAGEGERVSRIYEIDPTDGEIREIQRRSRLASGNITIGKDLARKVATGEMSMETAVEHQRERK